MDTQLEALAAWIDGEPVVRNEVARALETPEGRDYVLDLMALRRMVAVTTPELAPKAATHSGRRWPAFAAAAAILMAVAAGYGAGRFTPAARTAPPAAIVPVSSPSAIAAPAPTRVIQLHESTDWRETAGGG